MRVKAFAATAIVFSVVVGICFPTSSAHAGGALVNQAVKNGADASCASNISLSVFISNVVPGDTLILTFAGSGGTSSPTVGGSITDDHGDIFDQSGRFASSNKEIEFACAQGVAGGPTTVSVPVTEGSAVNCAAAVNLQEYSGVTCVTEGAAGGTATNASPGTGDVTANNPNDLIVAAADFDKQFSSPTTGPTNGFTELDDSSNANVDLFSAYEFVNAAGSFGTSWTISSSDSWLTGITAFMSTPPDSVLSSYYDVATSASQSRSGYGGPGFSGGAGDNTVRIVNPTSLNNDFQGAACAMIYVFDDFEEMQACCGCPVTSDGLRTLSTVNDLTFDFGVNKGNLNAGVIEIVSSQPNFFNPNPPPGPNPPGTNGFCSPTGEFNSDPFHRPGAIVQVSALRAWITHDESQQPGNIRNGNVVQGTTVDEFQASPPDNLHLSDLQRKCSALISNGSGAGVCTCGVGDSGPPNVVVR